MCTARRIGWTPFLRRPISIHAVDRQRGEVALFYRVVGRGTALLAAKEKGDQLNILGPLGRGFTMPPGKGKVAVVAGGIGIAPLYFLLQELESNKISADVFLGGATGQQLFLAVKSLDWAIMFSRLPMTEQRGHQGNVVSLFARGPSDFVYGCGPAAMLQSLCRVIEKHKIRGEISLEERMGCGVGVCLSCACKTRGQEGELPLQPGLCGRASFPQRGRWCGHDTSSRRHG
ncbi:MAG: dihydroorotate dehydrogenase electron transfer subunit [Candidatus Syntrophopropionicum ammoniitolerans]